MCRCNDCQGTGWIILVRWHMYGGSYYQHEREQEPCRCNPTVEDSVIHSDKECVRDVTLGQ